jgi:AcrR family transcriptional regulator
MRLILDPSKADTVLPRVIRAALRLFVEKGIDGATIKDIAGKAGVSEGALYRHFKSKNELAWHIFTVHLNRFALELTEQVSRAQGSRDKIRAYIAYCFQAFEEDRDLFTYLISSEHRELDRFPKTHVHPGHVALRLIEDGQKAGELRKMPVPVAASILLGAVHRLSLVRIYGTIPEDLRRHEDVVADALWQSLRKQAH